MTTPFNFGPDVSFSYANYDDCKRYDIEPIPWLWGEYWVKERINHDAETIGVVTNKPNGNFLEIYKKIEQKHPFHNLILQSSPLPWHVLYETIPLCAIHKSKIIFDQLISWAAIEYLTDEERLYFFNNVVHRLYVKGSLLLSFKHFFKLHYNAFLFFNSEWISSLNHQYPSHVDLKTILSKVPQLELSDSSDNILYAYSFEKYSEEDLIQCPEIISIKYFDLIDRKTFYDKKEVIPIIKNVMVGYTGIKLKRIHNR